MRKRVPAPARGPDFGRGPAPINPGEELARLYDLLHPGGWLGIQTGLITDRIGGPGGNCF
jgi:hypothetical protein